jgi:hypothetical protein
LRNALILTACCALPLAACKQEAAPANGAAPGQVLPGSISDAMLPEDRVTSHPPLDPGAVRVRASGAAAEDATGAPVEDAALAADATKAAE